MYKYTLTGSEGMEKYVLCKWKPKIWKADNKLNELVALSEEVGI